MAQEGETEKIRISLRDMPKLTKTVNPNVESFVQYSITRLPSLARHLTTQPTRQKVAISACMGCIAWLLYARGAYERSQTTNWNSSITIDLNF